MHLLGTALSWTLSILGYVIGAVIVWIGLRFGYNQRQTAVIAGALGIIAAGLVIVLLTYWSVLGAGIIIALVVGAFAFSLLRAQLMKT